MKELRNMNEKELIQALQLPRECKDCAKKIELIHIHGIDINDSFVIHPCGFRGRIIIGGKR